MEISVNVSNIRKNEMFCWCNGRPIQESYTQDVSKEFFMELKTKVRIMQIDTRILINFSKVLSFSALGLLIDWF